MEELQAKHRKEQKELQGRITQKKKNATKKTRKGVNDECERLERELKERQQEETDRLNGVSPEADIDHSRIDDSSTVPNGDKTVPNDKAVSFSDPTKGDLHEDSEGSQRAKKPSRQKARLARRAAEQEAQAAAAAEEAASQPDLREQEMTAMKNHKERLKLTETVIRPDGHCLFSACAKGLPSDAVRQSGPHTEGYQNVRYTTADYMSKHREDFEAFLEEPFDGYVQKIKDTAEWGGQLELQAIAKAYKVTIHVLQADGRIEEFQSDESNTGQNDLWLAYYRHSFGLGEHYNALSKT